MLGLPATPTSSRAVAPPFDTSARCVSRPAVPLRRPPVIAAGSLKKETKKLTKALKAHRKRLECLLAPAQQQDAAAAGPAPVAAAPLSSSQLHAVLAEVAQLQTCLAAVRQQQRRLAAMQQAACDSSDSSDSDCEEDEPSTMQREAQPQPQQQQRVLNGAPSAARIPVAAAAATAAICLEPPAGVQQQQQAGDLCQQLPAPRRLAAAGRVLVCQGKACVRKGGLQVLQAASHATAASPGVEVLPCKCLGKCKQAPAMRARREGQPRSTLVTAVAPLEVPAILEQLLRPEDEEGSG